MLSWTSVYGWLFELQTYSLVCLLQCAFITVFCFKTDYAPKEAGDTWLLYSLEYGEKIVTNVYDNLQVKK